MSKIAKATVVLMMFTLLSKFLGFIRETVLVAVYGASLTADAYIIAIDIPTVLFATIGVALSTTFIPLYFEVIKSEGEDSALKFANNTFNIVILISIILAMLGYVFAYPLTKMFAMNFNNEKLIVATSFTQIMIWGVVFIGLSNIMTAWLQIKGKFQIPGMVGIAYNTIIITGIILSGKVNVRILPIAALLAMISQFLFQLPFAYRNGYRYKLIIDFKDKYFKKICFLILPVFIGVGVNQLNVIIDRSLASGFGDGIITILNSANKLNNFVMGLFITTIISVIYPKLSKLSSEDDTKRFSNTICKSVNSIIILIVPISVGAILLSEPIVRLVFERGKFTNHDTKLAAIALSYYSIGMLAFALREILNKIFYSLKDTKTPMKNATLTMIMNIILNLILIQFIGFKGLPLATSISAIVCVSLLFIDLKKKISYFGQDMMLITLFKCIVSATVMGCGVKFSYHILTNIFNYEILSLLFTISIGVIIYLLSIVLLKVEGLHLILDKFKLRFS